MVWFRDSIQREEEDDDEPLKREMGERLPAISGSSESDCNRTEVESFNPPRWTVTLVLLQFLPESARAQATCRGLRWSCRTTSDWMISDLWPRRRNESPQMTSRARDTTPPNNFTTFTSISLGQC
jgi:hypothetical protein